MVKSEYGLIGKRLGHSFSADFFNKKFAEEGISARYSLFPLENIKELPGLLRLHPNLKGLNVTIPYKQDVMAYLDIVSEEAADIGAVNVIKISKERGKAILKGFNSDCIGFRNSLVPLLNERIDSALILGTGGASKAVKYVLGKLGIRVTFVSRTPSERNLTYKDLNREIIENNLLIVNTTPLGMYPDIDHCPPIPYEFITPNHICYDLIYNPEETLFLRRSKERGAIVKNGLEMLIGQAVESWEIWNK